MYDKKTVTVSVIIPCYNQSHFLRHSIESVLYQTFNDYEIIVVDDGSTDYTKKIALQFPQVKYIYQQNCGLSAARNTGIKNSIGQYLVFLDADDWLYPDALQINVNFLNNNPDVAFVSGAHNKVYGHLAKTTEVKHEKAGDYFCHLLHHNFIGMIAAVMFRRCVFKKFEFDINLKACEDYDLYLKITRDYPIIHHTNTISAYRIHPNSMSSNQLFMLKTILSVKKKYKSSIKTRDQMKAYYKGNAFYKSYYFNELYLNIKSNKLRQNLQQVLSIVLNKPQYIFRFFMEIVRGRFQLK